MDCWNGSQQDKSRALRQLVGAEAEVYMFAQLLMQERCLEDGSLQDSVVL